MYNRTLHWFVVFTSFCTFLLIIAGGLVTSTGSGLAVPDWPLSYGQLMPPMVGGIFYEHGHRMIATAVGILTIIMVVWIWKREPRRWVKWLALTCLAAIVVQGALGGMTVLFMLPTAVSVAHASLAQTFFSLVCSLALFSSKWWLSNVKQESKIILPRNWLTYCVIVVCIIYLQLILGAVMRHTGSGLAIPDFPLSYGQMIPSLSREALETYNRHLIYDDIRLAADGPIVSGQILVHFLHRFWALVVVGATVALSIVLGRYANKSLRRYCFLIMTVVLSQVAMGAWTVLSKKAVAVATAHVAIGALLLVSTVLLTLSVAKLSGRFAFESVQERTSREVYA